MKIFNKIRTQSQKLGPYYIPILILYLIFVGRFISTFFGSPYDRDLDHFLYLSQRFLSGELIYVKEYDEKLPIIQLLFVIPAFLKSYKSWILINTSIAVFTSLSLSKIIKKIIFYDWRLVGSKESERIACFGSAFYLCSIASLPGSLYHINLFASNMLILSIYTLLYSNSINYIRFLKSALFASIAISLRPYYALPAILLIVWNTLRTLLIKYKFQTLSIYHSLKKIFLNFIIWIAALIFTVAITNGTPYFATNKVNSLINGIIHLSADLQPQTTSKTVLQYQLSGIYKFGNIEALVYLSFIIPTLFVIINTFKKNNITIPNLSVIYTDIAFISFLSPLLIEIVLLNKHFWDHYHQFFIVFSSLSLCFAISLISRSELIDLNVIKIYKNFFGKFILILLLLSLTRTEISKTAYYLSKVPSLHPHQNKLEQIKLFLSKRKSKEEETDFLDPQGMYSHWKLEESRHGFPVALVVDNIFRGEWSGVDRVLDVIPYTRQQLCKKLQNDAPSIIFIEEDSEEEQCLESVKFNYDISNIGVIKENITLYAYTRKYGKTK